MAENNGGGELTLEWAGTKMLGSLAFLSLAYVSSQSEQHEQHEQSPAVPQAHEQQEQESKDIPEAILDNDRIQQLHVSETPSVKGEFNCLVG